MARFARLVVPDHPHHVTQRGNRRQNVFFKDADYTAYLDLLVEWAAKADTAIWGYCLMPNHVHLILVPRHEDGLRAALGETHRRYTRRINAREQWSGHLWQDRFHSFPMSEDHLAACARYVELNPVRLGLVKKPKAWPWSSARAHLKGEDDGIVTVDPLLSRVPDWKNYLKQSLEEKAFDRLRLHGRTGRPLGGESWIGGLEQDLGRRLRSGAPRGAAAPRGAPERRP